MTSDWQIEITTSGGFTGRGAGHVSVASLEKHEAVARAVAAAHPERWKRDYRGDARGADELRYTLVLTRGAGRWAANWNESAYDSLPHDLAALFDAAWKEKQA